MKTRPLRLLPQQRQRKYNDDTAVEYTITHVLPTGMRDIDRNTAHSEISCVLSVWAIFHPLGYPYDSSYSYCINTVNYTKILHTRLSYILILVAGIVGILFSSSLRCLFLLRMQPIFASHIYNPPARHLAFNLGMRIEYVWNTMRIRSITGKAIDFAFG